MKKRILFVSNTAYSIFQFRSGVIKSFIKKDFDVICIAPVDQFAERLRGLGCTFVNVDIAARGKNPFSDIQLIRDLYKLYKKYSPEVVFHFTIKPNIYGSFAALLSRIPSVAVTTGLGHSFGKRNLTSAISYFLYFFAFKFPREVWFLNNDDRNAFVEKRLVLKSRSYVLPSEGVDVSYYKSRKKATCTKPTFLMLSRMLWDKGVGEYIRAAEILKSKYPNVQFQLLGRISDDTNSVPLFYIEKWVDKGIIEYLGASDDVRPFIENSTCIVLPSKYREGIPRCLLEAASMERVVITTDWVGCRETVVNGVTGYLCQINDHVDLADKMEQIIQASHEKLEDMGRKAREKIQREFDEAIVVSRYHEFLSKLNGNFLEAPLSKNGNL